MRVFATRPNERGRAQEGPTRTARAGMQRKLTVGAPNDAFEQEADSVADRVMRMPDTKVQRKCAGCEDEALRRSRDGAGPSTAAAAAPVVAGGGAPLDAGARRFMERRFGHDFSRIRIHADDQAAASARAVHAHAYTVGNHIAFADGQYAPNTDAGRRLLAHELTHTIQQEQAGPRIQRNFNPGRCCNSSEQGEDEFALVSNPDDTEARWVRLAVGECVGNPISDDCEGMTCGGGFYYVDGWTMLIAPGVCSTPRNDSWPFTGRRWTPTSRGPKALAPSERAKINDTPPGYQYDP